MVSDRPVLWVLVEPVYLPAPGGGAIQADTIARAMATSGDDVLILSEAFPGERSHEILERGAGEASVVRLFPYRAGRARKDFWSYLTYVSANLHYLRLPSIIGRASRRSNYSAIAILIHTSLLYKPNLLEKVLDRLRAAGNAPVVIMAELQDSFYPEEKLGLLSKFDAIVTTSKGVEETIKRRAPDIADRVSRIPMPFVGPDIPSDAYVARTLAAYGLQGQRYLFNPNGLTGWKHASEMRDAIPILRKIAGFEDVILVTAGRERDRTPADNKAEAEGYTRYLGPVSPKETLALMRGAMMTLVLSQFEAISRAAVEAIWVGGKVILPDLAEYRETCQSHICSDVTSEGIARKIVELHDKPMPAFPFDSFSEEVFTPLYRSVVNAALERDGVFQKAPAASEPATS